MKKCLFPWISPPLLLLYLFKIFLKRKEEKEEMGELLYLPSFRDSYSLIVTFMIQYCDLHIMFKLNQIFGPLYWAFQANPVGEWGGEGIARGRELHFYMSVVYSVVFSAVCFTFVHLPVLH